MFEGSEYHKDAIELVESCPTPHDICKPGVGIMIMSGKDYKAKADLKNLNVVLASIQEPTAIKMFDISYDSKLTKLPDIERFPNIEILNLCARGVKDYSKVRMLKKINRFFVCNYTYNNLSTLALTYLDYFRAIRGSLSVIDISIRMAFLQGCSNLLEIESVKIEKLILESCKQFSLDSLRKVKNLKELTLRSQKTIPNFEFLEDLPELQNLAVTANNLSKTDISALAVTKVPFIFLGVRDLLIHELAKLNRNIVITNGIVTYQNGVEQHSNSPYYDGVRELTK
jgi:hypothetical protein